MAAEGPATTDAPSEGAVDRGAPGADDDTGEPSHQTGHTVLVGYGQVGRIVAAGIKTDGGGLVVIEDSDHDVAAARAEGQADAAQVRSRVTEAQTAVADVQTRLAQLEMRAALPGRLDLPDTTALEGRFFARGDIIGHVLPEGVPVVRLAVPQTLAALVTRETRDIALRFAAAPDRVLPAEILRVVPAGGDVLPSPVLALDGGGPFATLPGGEGPLRAATQLFQLDLRLPVDAPRPAYGMRAHVRFAFAPKPLAVRIGREIRALFLRAFDV